MFVCFVFQRLLDYLEVLWWFCVVIICLCVGFVIYVCFVFQRLVDAYLLWVACCFPTVHVDDLCNAFCFQHFMQRWNAFCFQRFMQRWNAFCFQRFMQRWNAFCFQRFMQRWNAFCFQRFIQRWTAFRFQRFMQRWNAFCFQRFMQRWNIICVRDYFSSASCRDGMLHVVRVERVEVHHVGFVFAIALRRVFLQGLRYADSARGWSMSCEN